MPDDRKPNAGDHDFDAALSAWERGAGDTPDPAPHLAQAGLRAQFAAHPDVCALTALTDAALNRASADMPVMVKVRPELAALLEHIESLDAAAAGRAPAPIAHVLSGIVSNRLEHLLHQLVTDPTSHPHYARLWNSLCADAGAPALAVPDPDAPPAPEAAEEGPF